MQSDAVDTAIADIDFSPLAGQKVFLDVRYVQDYKGIGFVNSPYIISALRQQMTGAGVLLQDNADQADIIVEPRVGTLGSDDHSVVYGIPANNALNTASVVLPNAPPLPSIPEMAVAKRNDHLAAVKIALFAYHRESRLAVWQSGTSLARSNAKDTWLLGAGPFTRGTIYNGWRFAGNRIPLPFTSDQAARPQVSHYHESHLFNADLLSPAPVLLAEEPVESDVVQASATGPAENGSSQTTEP